ncbi:imidazole glycerol phosphate synthase subunit HisH [Polluticoccus soli]|uniref:imidazole glycerol phosphate synthase subunit HisH n=1 Tax=Polluticoccus soli TaxID=3034150 RepID=UPI0023E2ACEF|nr:imidazole glycerol phosphate synthase subunit HisH [Flavipsychrobacter sp. JY13-12]
MITIVDYGMGNWGSVRNMLKRIGVSAEITSDPETILKAKKIILPGVGSFDAAMSRIDALGLREPLTTKAVKEKIPVLGICLGMQLLTASSEEGERNGLNWIPAKTVRFQQRNALYKVPHMGWNLARQVRKHVMTSSFDRDTRFYFVHSYHVVATEEKYVLADTKYGYDFASIITNGDNVFGAQFHPEKSHSYGMHFLESFSKL